MTKGFIAYQSNTSRTAHVSGLTSHAMGKLRMASAHNSSRITTRMKMRLNARRAVRVARSTRSRILCLTSTSQGRAISTF